jgi:hypothetical protein
MRRKGLRILLGIIALLIVFVIKGFIGLMRNTKESTSVYATQENEQSKKILELAEKFDNDTGRCSFSTNELWKAQGINISIFVPCRWQQFDATQSTVVKQFGHDINENESVGLTLDISPLNFQLTNQWIEKFCSETFIK